MMLSSMLMCLYSFKQTVELSTCIYYVYSNMYNILVNIVVKTKIKRKKLRIKFSNHQPSSNEANQLIWLLNHRLGQNILHYKTSLPLLS